MRTKLSTRARSGLALGITLSLGLLAAGCGDDGSTDDEAGGGGGDGSAYCEALRSAAEDIGGMMAGSPDLSKFSDVVAQINDIVPTAPDELADEWKGLAEPLTALDKALTEADVDLAAFAQAAASGAAPPGVTPEQMVTLGEAIAKLQDPKIGEYGDAIAADAKESCGVDLADLAS